MRPAQLKDLDQIFALRDAYYQARNQPVQIRDGIQWTVAEHGFDIVACQATRDEAGQREQTDFYRAPNRWGTVGAVKLMREVHAQASRENVMLWGHTEPDNLQNLQAAIDNGWSIGGVLIYRNPEVV